MGKIKSKSIKRTANIFIKKGIKFSEDFEKNKKILKGVIPSKKLKNQMAGFLSKTEKQRKQDESKLPNK